MSFEIPIPVQEVVKAYSDSIVSGLEEMFKDDPDDPFDAEDSDEPAFNFTNTGLHVSGYDGVRRLQISEGVEVLEIKLRDSQTTSYYFRENDTIGVAIEVSGIGNSGAETPKYVRASFYHDPPRQPQRTVSRKAIDNLKSRLIGSIEILESGSTTITEMTDEETSLVSKVLGITNLTDHLLRFFQHSHTLGYNRIGTPYTTDDFKPFLSAEVAEYLLTGLKDLTAEGDGPNIGEVTPVRRLETVYEGGMTTKQVGE